MPGLPIGRVLGLDGLAAPRRVLLVLGVLLLLGLFAVGRVAASKKGRHLTQEEVAEVWIGISGDELYLLRIALEPNGEGVGADSLRGEEPKVFRIRSWDYRPPVITIETEPSASGESYELGTLRGQITGVVMHLTVSGDGWQTEYELRREAEFEQRLVALKMAMGEEPEGRPP